MSPRSIDISPSSCCIEIIIRDDALHMAGAHIYESVLWYSSYIFRCEVWLRLVLGFCDRSSAMIPVNKVPFGSCRVMSPVIGCSESCSVLDLRCAPRFPMMREPQLPDIWDILGALSSLWSRRWSMKRERQMETILSAQVSLWSPLASLQPKLTSLSKLAYYSTPVHKFNIHNIIDRSRAYLNTDGE